MKNISKEDIQNFLKTFDTEKCTIIGDFYGEPIILDGRKSLETIISDAIIAVDNILESPSKVVWKNEEKIDFTEYFDYWRKMKKELLEREGIYNKIIFIYLFEYTGDDPVTEHRLNHDSVNNLKDVNNIIRNDKFIFNTRVIKYILKADVEEFVSFITYQSEIFQETLFHYSILNEYHKNKKYKLNFDILNNLINK